MEWSGFNSPFLCGILSYSLRNPLGRQLNECFFSGMLTSQFRLSCPGENIRGWEGCKNRRNDKAPTGDGWD